MTFRDSLGLLGTLWYLLVPFDTFWYDLVPFGYILVPFGTFLGTIWYVLVPFGYILVPFDTFWYLLVLVELYEPCRTLQDPVDAAGQ